MLPLLENVLSASFHGSIVIFAVLLLRLVLKKAPRKYICWLWLLAGLRLLMPIEIRSDLSLQPQALPLPRLDASIWGAVLPGIWLCIACCFAVYSLVSYRKLKRKVREAVRIRGGWESDRIDTAFILGFIRPQIYIPMGMGKQDRKYILEHERTHLDKGDHWIKMIGFLALALHWFNPLVWVAYLCLCRDIEMACDERVVQFMELEERKGYSAALLSCSTNHVHYFASPVAFGEISVKERIMTVLNYKKPGFWVSLLSLAAIAFVAVCLVTSPAREPEEIIVESTASTEPAQEPSLEEQARQKVSDSFRTIRESDCYGLSFMEVDDHGAVGWQAEYYKDGENTFWRSSNHVNGDGHLHYEGKDYVLNEDGYWIPGEPLESQLEELLGLFSLEGKDLYNTVIESKTRETTNPYEKLSFVAQWAPEPERLNTQPMTFWFSTRGVLAEAEIKNVNWGNEENLIFYYNTASKSDVRGAFSHVLEKVQDEELLESMKTRPSNYTEYDLNFTLGAAQMGWQFLDGEWFFKFGAEDVTRTGAKLVVECSIPYGSNTVAGGRVTSGGEYYIERLEENTWVDVPRMDGGDASLEPKDLGTGDTLSIDWSECYGTLPGGYYRIGMYYDCTADNGETDNRLCYAKFRLYEPVDETLLSRCRESLAQLAELSHFQITKYYNIVPSVPGPEPTYVVDEIWRCGENWLNATRVIVKERDVVLRANGTLVRDGQAYTLEWEDNNPRKPVSAWETNTYVEESNYTIKLNDLEGFDSEILQVTEEENRIILLENEDFRDLREKEIGYQFDDEGNLTGVTASYTYSNGTKQVEEELIVLSRDAGDIDTMLSGQDVSTPGSFSWVEDKKNLGEQDTAKVGGFVNTKARGGMSVELAIELAHAEAPHYKDYTNEFSNVKAVFYDEEAEMWKVSCKFSHDSCLWYDVYLDAQGVTQLMIERITEPEW